MSDRASFSDDTTIMEVNPFAAGRVNRSLLIHHHDGIDLVPLVPSVPITVGRAREADVVFRGAHLSRRHARFELVGGVVWVEDLGATNGTLVNGVRIAAPMQIGSDDEVHLGTVVVRVVGFGPDERRQHGIDSHDRFVRGLEDELRRARTFGRKAALVMVHAAGGGGEHLHRWAPGVRELVREVDRVGLYGPQILEICVAEADAAEATELAQRVVASAAPSSPGHTALHCGIAVFPEAGRTPDQLFTAAREALHSASAADPVQIARASETISTLADAGDDDGPVVRSPAMVALYRTAERVAGAAVPVLLQGETGTGKEILARYLHAQSPRASAPLQCINCGALPESLVESILFGHEKGAFTGATRRQEGVFEAARGGTILLDEIGELPLQAQVALLRVLEAREIRRVGGNATIKVDVRVIAATNRDLEAMVREGRFRDDLLFRINVMTLRIPPLRERLAEIPALATHFIDQAAFECGRSVTGLSPTALSCLLRYHWPGNVRELRNVIQRAVLVTLGERIEADDLPERLQDRWSRQEEEEEPDEPSIPPERDTGSPTLRREERALQFKYAVRACETALIRHTLIRTDGNVSAAAKLLGIPRRTLSYKVHNYGIDPSRGDGAASAVLARLSEPGDQRLNFRDRIARIEARLIEAALKRCGKEPAATARELGLHPATLDAKRQRYGL